VSRFDPWARTLQTDILHVFGSSHHQAEIVFRAAARGIPVVITSMFVRTHSARSYAMGKMADQLGLRTLYSVRRKILHTATRVIATSDAERDDLVEVFDVDEGKIDVIGNGVDDQFFTATADAFRNRYHQDDMVLCVASVEPNKNQLTLIDAVERTGLPLVLIGPPKDTVVDNVAAYVDAVRKRVAAAFAAARLHVLPSRAEAQGIVNLEAAAAGASLVMSDLDTLRSTFGDDAWYADPTSPQQLAEAIKSAWAVPRGERYQHYPDHKPTWLHSWSDVTLLLESTYERAVRK
jgi:glycosyltransferase involved in cell wall biosynthesis